MVFSRSVAVLLFIIVAILAISSADPPDKHTQTGFTTSPSPSSPRHIPSSGRKHSSRIHKDSLVAPDGHGFPTSPSPSSPRHIPSSGRKHPSRIHKDGSLALGAAINATLGPPCAANHIRVPTMSDCLPIAALDNSCKDDVQCSHIKRASCVSKICKCQDGYIKDGEVCIEKIYPGGTCVKKIQCSWVANSTCLFENNTCVCQNGFRKDGNACIEIKLGGTCEDASHCSWINSSTCSSNKCACQEGFRQYRKECFERKVGGVCYDDLICELNNTECSEGRCYCLEAYHQSGKSCIQTRLDDNCTSEADCRFVNGTCNEDSKTCTCGRFQKPVEDKCVEKILVFGDLCDTDEQCKGNLTNGHCIDHSCYCDKFHKYDRETNGCILNTESLCNEQSHCDQYPNTTCLKEYCLCNVDNTTLRNGVCPEPYNSGSTIRLPTQKIMEHIEIVPQEVVITHRGPEALFPDRLLCPPIQGDPVTSYFRIPQNRGDYPLFISLIMKALEGFTVPPIVNNNSVMSNNPPTPDPACLIGFNIVQQACEPILARTFYRFICIMVIANVFNGITHLLTTVPTSIIEDGNKFFAFQTSDFYIGVNAVNTFSYQVVLLTTLLIAVHRFFVFIMPDHADTVFSGGPFLLITAVQLLVSSFIAVFFAYTGCSFRNNVPRESALAEAFQLKCSKSFNDNQILTIARAYEAELLGLPFLILVIYIIIFVKIVCVRRNFASSNRSPEFNILKQAVAIFIIFEIPSCIFAFMVIIPHTGGTAFQLRIFKIMLELFAGAATPLLFFSTSQEFRRALKHAFITMANSHSTTVSVLKTTPEDKHLANSTNSHK